MGAWFGIWSQPTLHHYWWLALLTGLALIEMAFAKCAELVLEAVREMFDDMRAQLKSDLSGELKSLREEMMEVILSDRN